MSLATRNLRLFIVYRITSRSILFAPYLYTYVTHTRGLGIAEFGALQSLYYCTAVALEVPSGVVADRFGRKYTLVLGALLASLGSAFRVMAHDFWLFALAEVCYASALALVSGADSALLFDSLASDGREEEYPRAEGIGQSSWLAATAIGMPLTDYFLIRDGDSELAFWATGALSLVSLFCALAMKEPPLANRQAAREITFGAVRDVVRVPGILRLLVYSTGVFILLRAAIILFFNPALAQAGVPVHTYGSVLALVNVVGAITAWRTDTLMKRFGDRLFLILMPTTLVVMYLLLIPVDTPIVAMLFGIQGAVFGSYPVAIRTLLNRLVPSPQRRATILSFESLGCRLVYAVMVLVIAGVLDAQGLQRALAVTVIAGCVPFAAMPLLARAEASVARRSPPR